MNDDERLNKKLETAIKLEGHLKTPLSENDKVEINEIASELKNFVKKNKKFQIKDNIFSKLKFSFLNFQFFGTATASLFVGIFFGQQFLSDFENKNDNLLTKSILLSEQEELISLQKKLEPGKKIAIDINNILLIFDMSKSPIEEESNCHKIDLEITGLTKSESIKLMACSEIIDDKVNWLLSDVIK